MTAMPATDPFDGLELWFLTGSQALYGPETLDQVAAQSAAVVGQLDAASDVPVRIVARPVLTSADAIRRACLDAAHDDRCIGVIAWMHTFSPAKMWIGGLQVLGKPLLHLHTQANESLPWSTIDMDFMNLNQAAHGDRELGFLQTRMGLERKSVFGHVSDPAVQASVGRWARAAAGHHALRTLSLARFGDNMRDVAVTEGDKVEAEMRFGVSVNTWGVNDLVDAVAAVPERQVNELIEQHLEAYDVVDALRPGGAQHESLRVAAAIEGGLRTFLADGGFGAFTTNFEDLGGLRQLPGLAVQRLMADGYGFGGEGDWKTSALLRALKVMGAGLPGGTSFMEDYTYHLGPGVPKTLGAHMLEVCPSIAADRPSCEVHPLAIGDREDPVRLVFDAAPGPAVVVGLCDLGSRFRLVGAEVDTVPPDEPLPALPVARAVWTSRPDLRIAATAWLTAGGPHHTVYSSAVDREMLEDLATMVDVELVTIDAATTVAGFRDRLRWNAAWYHLAQGL
ncbi:MAG: L-arabinose isomerase [Acidimicrobiia bacterium]|nr:L-arabinose isomerase [Acidimicrobiia bacterium]